MYGDQFGEFVCGYWACLVNHTGSTYINRPGGCIPLARLCSSRAWWPVAPNYCSRASRKSLLFHRNQHVPKVVSNSPGLVDFVTCPTGKWSILRNSTYRRTRKSILLIKKFWGLDEMTFGLVNATFSLPKWQAVKMTFFEPCKSNAGHTGFHKFRALGSPQFFLEYNLVWGNKDQGLWSKIIWILRHKRYRWIFDWFL